MRNIIIGSTAGVDGGGVGRGAISFYFANLEEIWHTLPIWETIQYILHGF